MSVVNEMKHKCNAGGERWKPRDLSRREIVLQLCGEKGLALYVFLLASSTIESDREDRVVCSLRSLRDVALQLGWSPDTIKRYVAIFRAMNLVHHYHDRRQEVTLYLPLGPYVPLTNFISLDELLGTRQKQRQLALKVKTRYITRYGDPTQVYSDEMQTKLQTLNTILDSEHLEPLKRQRLHRHIAELLTSLIGKTENASARGLSLVLDDPETAPERRRSDELCTKGDLNETSSVIWSAKRAGQRKQPVQEGDLNQQQRTLTTQDVIPSGQVRTRMGDPDRQQGGPCITAPSTREQHIKQVGDLKQQEGDSLSHILLHLERRSQAVRQEQGDPDQQKDDRTIQQPHNGGHWGDSKAQAGDVDSHTLPTYNVLSLIDTITKNIQRKRTAQFLGNVLENNTEVFPKYLKLFHDYSAEIIGKAFLTTLFLIHQEGWSVQRPGGLFTSQCKGLSTQIPPKGFQLDDVERWLQRWGTLAYPELIVALTKPLVTPAHANLIIPKASPSTPVSPGSAFPVDPSLRIDGASVIMNRCEAEDLIRRILQDERTRLFRVQRARVGKQEQGRYIVVVDASIPGGSVHQTIVYSEQDWQHRLITMQTWRDLFLAPPSFSKTMIQEAKKV